MNLGKTGAPRAMQAQPMLLLSSLQPLGAEAQVLVEFYVGAYGLAEIVGAVVDGLPVSAECFADSVLHQWRAAIADEIRRDREEDEEARDEQRESK